VTEPHAPTRHKTKPTAIDPGQRVIVVVADDALGHQLQSYIDQHPPKLPVAVHEVSSFLAAMGEMAQHRVDLVVGPMTRTAGMWDAMGQSLKRLSPNGQFLLTTDQNPEAEIEAAKRAGFTILTPDQAQPGSILEKLEPTPAPGSSTPGNSTTGSSAPVGENSLGNSEQDASPAVLTSPATLVDKQAHELGDVDLIEALLDDGCARLGARALRIVRARSGLADATIVATPDHVTDDHSYVSLSHRGQRLGVLTAPPPASVQDLMPWGDWLSRWMSMGQQFDQLRDLSFKDELTGVWNRRYFNRFLHRLIERASEQRRDLTLMVFDIDDFKIYNDRFGHPAGDEILQETAKLMVQSIRNHDVVARIGGDEFAVIFWDNDEAPRKPNSHHPQDVLAAAKRFQQAVYAHRFPKLLDHAPGTLTISGGLASFPWDGRTPQELVDHADAMALNSKRQGKNAITFGPGALGNGNGNPNSNDDI